jgi:D-threo-aldose 1-dehydrogenase
MGGLSRRDSLRLLDAAFDAGVRHFDVAPMYGFGEAEGCLGEFLVRHASEVTVTTKFGIEAGQPSAAKSIARAVARPVIKALPAVKKLFQQKAATVARGVSMRTPFTAEKMRASLERSLRRLQTGHIDVWLLHEARSEDLKDERILRVLEEAVASGSVGTFGVGSGREHVETLLAERPAYCRTLQFEWSVLDRPVPELPAFRIHHRALTENFRRLKGALEADAATLRRWSDAIGMDVTAGDTLAQLMLKAALIMNRESVILFSTKHVQHLRNNILAAEDASLEEPTRRLYALIQSEGIPQIAGSGEAS